MSTGAIEKPKSKAHKRFLENREPKLVENDKRCLFLRGGNSSAVVTKVMSTIHSMKKPNAMQFHQKNMLRPFEDYGSLEFFAKKNDTSQFIFGSTSKKRPHNMIFGRFFNGQLLDMAELGVFACEIPNKLNISAEIKPILTFTGHNWTETPELERLRNIFTDIFSCQRAETVRLQGLELQFNFELSPDAQKVHFSAHHIRLKKSGTKVPRVEIEPVGFTIDFSIRRHHNGSGDLWKQSMKRPKTKALGQAPKKAKKNREYDDLGNQYGRVHLEKQDYSKLELTRTKALYGKDPVEEKQEDAADSSGHMEEESE